MVRYAALDAIIHAWQLSLGDGLTAGPAFRSLRKGDEGHVRSTGTEPHASSAGRQLGHAQTRSELVHVYRDYEVLTHDDGIDHIITNAPRRNVINDDPALNIDQHFRSTGRHLALFGELLLSAPRP